MVGNFPRHHRDPELLFRILIGSAQDPHERPGIERMLQLRNLKAHILRLRQQTAPLQLAWEVHHEIIE